MSFRRKRNRVMWWGWVCGGRYVAQVPQGSLHKEGTSEQIPQWHEGASLGMREGQQVASAKAYRQEWRCHVHEQGRRPVGLKWSEWEGECRGFREVEVLEGSSKGGEFEAVLSVSPQQNSCTVTIHSSSTGVGDHSERHGCPTHSLSQPLGLFVCLGVGFNIPLLLTASSCVSFLEDSP